MSYKPYAHSNVDIFWDTIRMINSNKELLESVISTISNSKVYSHEDEIECLSPKRFDNSFICKISNKRTYQAAMDSVKSNSRTAVLNFANAFTPGGGVLNGSGAQEESLCRCSTLYPCLNFDEAYKKYYGYNNSRDMGELGSDGIIYSPDVKILKTDESAPKRLPIECWTDVDVITCAAPHLLRSTLVDGYIETMTSRVRRIIQVATENKVDNLILGAFGCGAFYNPPEIVAHIFKEVLDDYKYSFKRVEFAIMGFDDNPNFVTFRKILA